MKLYQNESKDNNRVAVSKKIINTIFGNIVPYQWHYNILSRGKSEFITISILPELLFLYHTIGSRNFDDKRLVYIENIKIIMPAREQAKSTNILTKNKLKELPSGIWGDIRRQLIPIYGEATDRNWFSKLEVQQDKDNKKLTLLVSSRFIRDWITQNYIHLIERIFLRAAFQSVEVLIIGKTTLGTF